MRSWRSPLLILAPRQDERIDDGATLSPRMHDHWIELDLGNVIAVGRSKNRELSDEIRQRRAVARRRAAEAVEQRRDAQLVQHVLGARTIDWRQAIGGVLEEFGRDAAGTHHDERAEGGIADRADDHLETLARHALQQHAL